MQVAVQLVDHVVAADDVARERDVLVLDRLQHATQLVPDQVEPTERGLLDAGELRLEADAELALGF